MSFNSNPKKGSAPDEVDHHIAVLGGSAAITKVAGVGQPAPTTASPGASGPGCTVTYVSTGLLSLNWADNPGMLVGFDMSFQATVPAGVKGYTAVAGVPSFSSTTGLTLQVSIYNSTFALADLAALQWGNITATFKTSSPVV